MFFDVKFCLFFKASAKLLPLIRLRKFFLKKNHFFSSMQKTVSKLNIKQTLNLKFNFKYSCICIYKKEKKQVYSKNKKLCLFSKKMNLNGTNSFYPAIPLIFRLSFLFFLFFKSNRIS